MKKIEKILTAIPAIMSIFINGRNVNPPAKKDYLGRFILSIAGLIIISFLVILIWGLVSSI
jgi:hypothetical protein